jgi:PAS domain S-box-containing protein
MSYVSGRFMSEFLGALSHNGIDVDTLIGDLPVGRPEVQLPVVEWSHFSELLARLERHLGGPEALVEIGASISELGPGHLLRRLGRLASSPVAAFRVVERLILPRALPGVFTRTETLPDGQLRFVMETDSDERACPQIFHLFAGIARSLPTLLDLPQAVVRREVSERRAELLIRPPPSGTLLSRTTRALRAAIWSRTTFHRLQLHHLELHNHILALEKSFAELQVSESKHRELAESRVDTLVQLSASGRFTYVSPSVENLTGYRADQVLGSHYALWLHRDEEQLARRVFSRILRNPRAERINPLVRIRHERGDWIWVELTAHGSVSASGERHAVAVIRDVSRCAGHEELIDRAETRIDEEVSARTHLLLRRNQDLRDLQPSLLAAERESTAREVASELGHAILGPLSGLALELEMLAKCGGERSAEIERILERTYQIGDVAERTLDVYGKRKVDLAPVDPRALMTQLQAELEPMTARRNVSLCCWIREPVGVFDADLGLIRSGLLCIAEEALEGLSPNDELGIEIAAATTELDGVEIQLWDSGRTVLETRRGDRTEPGIAAEDSAAHRFGVGMTVARTIARGHRGQIRLEARPGGGNVVTLTIPCSASEHDDFARMAAD